MLILLQCPSEATTTLPERSLADCIKVIHVVFLNWGVVRSPARLNSRTGIVDEIKKCDQDYGLEQVIEEGIEAFDRPLYAKTFFCEQSNALRVKNALLLHAFVTSLLEPAEGDLPPPLHRQIWHMQT